MAMPILLALLSGCVAIQPFPNYARPGDTITLAVGSQDGMNRQNTQVWFTSDANPANPVEVTSGIRSIFNLYADKGSRVYSPNNNNADTNFRYLHHEQWQTVIALDLPQALPTGPGTVRIQTTVPQPRPLESGMFGDYPDVNTVSVRIEILPGTGTPNPLDYKTAYGGTLGGNYSDLQAARQALVRPPVEDPQGAWNATYGAIELKINLPLADINSGTLSENNVRVVTQDVTTYTRSKLQMTWSLSGNTLTVLFISASGKIRYYEPRFSIMADAANFTATPAMLSVQYFDVNGNAVNGPGISDYSVNVTGLPSY
jgi:hypothetical protein